MANRLKKVVFGLIGATLDRGQGAARWELWRPSVAVCQHEDLLVDRFELLCQTKFCRLAEQVAKDIAAVSPETTVRLHRVEFDDAWDFEAVYGALHEFTGSYPFDLDHEEYLVHITTGTHVAQICLFLLTESRRIPGTLLQTSPATRPNHDPAGTYSLIDLDLSKYDRLATRFRSEQQTSLSFLKSGIATRNPAFNKLIEQIEHVAIESTRPLLLMGPTGAGKSQLARRIHELKKQRKQCAGPFVEVNCATLRGDSAMSALFGHVRGSFTGAMRDRQGLLKSADGGILFLDEIGELGADEQAMLLRALEEHLFLPLGSDREVKSEFQLIAGTNRDLHAEAAQGRFREDLLARINLWTFVLPGLRERPEDFEPNLDYELSRLADQGARAAHFNKEARDRYLCFARSGEAEWRSNFRDLNASVTRMATLAEAGRITLAVVDEEIGRLRRQWRRPAAAGNSFAALEPLLGGEALDRLDEFDRVQLAYVIGACRESRTLSDAGRRLFQASRLGRSVANDADRLRKYLARFSLSWEKIRTED